jgi:radical SAM superfamily enzyme YgiQ (UPF0313 family)
MVLYWSDHHAGLLFPVGVAFLASSPFPGAGAQPGHRRWGSALALAALMKTLGLIAMSGVRVVNPELKSLGLTLPGFVERGKVIASLPTLGLLTLAGLTSDRWEISYHDVFDINTLDKMPGPFDLVAISSLAAQVEEAYVLADGYRAQGSCVVMGGLHVSAEPQEALQHSDAIVIGEAEPVWAKLLEDFEAGRLQRVYQNPGPQFDLADSPMPRFDLLDPTHYNRITLQTQRGCPFKCEFCAASIRIAPQFRTKPIDRVIGELNEIKKLWRHPFIELADDNTFANRARGKRLVRALAAENIHWFTETDISVADDPELLRLLRESGCSQILIGLESPVIAGMEGLEQKANWKAKQVDRYRTAIQRIQDHGITVNGCFILGLDGSGPETFDALWRFIHETALFEVQLTVLTPFAGTPLYQRLSREGRLLYPRQWNRCTLFDVNFRPDRMTVEALETGLRDLMGRVYNKEFTTWRRNQFFERLRQRRMSSRSRRGSPAEQLSEV